jgi:uncharacterized RDD family membrane protein YckC
VPSAPSGSTAPPAPSYGAVPPAPSYGGIPSAPSYGSAPPAPGYGATPSAPSYGSAPPAPGYGAAPSAPSYGSVTPTPGYGSIPPTPGYGAAAGPGEYYPPVPPPAPSSLDLPPQSPFGASATPPPADPATYSGGLGAPAWNPGQAAATYGQSQPSGHDTPNYGQSSYPAAAPGQPPYPTTYQQQGYPPQQAYPPVPYTPPSAITGYDPSRSAGTTGPLAPWQKRVLGAVIDYGPIVIVNWINDRLTWGVLSGLLSLVTLAWFIYNTLYLGGKTGVSFGRKAAGTKLVRESTGQPIGIGLALVRWICHAIDTMIIFIGWLFPLWDSKRQTLADKIVGTVVIESNNS